MNTGYGGAGVHAGRSRFRYLFEGKVVCIAGEVDSF